ncbi:MAG: hypothetical protein DHS20C10_13780 [marine bacterium B5-7]|nr:MAG: hypothetical protein DHS20C10_13780 [marine bacterium B5-7]
MLSISLPEDIDTRLQALADKTGRTKSLIACSAITEYIEEIESVLESRENPDDVFDWEALKQSGELDS